MSVKIVALYAASNALFNIFLASRVSSFRRSEKVSIGVGSSKPLEIAVRTHANNAEFVPLALVLILIAELMGGVAWGLHLAGGGLLLGRALHAFGMPKRAPNFWRVGGTALTWTVIGCTSLWLLLLHGVP